MRSIAALTPSLVACLFGLGAVAGCTPAAPIDACNPACAAGSHCALGACVPDGPGPDMSEAGPDMALACNPPCEGATSHCNANHQCVACLTDDHCPRGQVCHAIAGSAACIPGCTDDARCDKGRSCCQSTCIDTMGDVSNCGGCGKTCVVPNAGATCTAGACTFGRCNPGFGDCNADPKDGCEANLHVDKANCGACKKACTFANAIGACSDTCYIAACNFGFDDCNADPMDGCETSVLTDVKNCGGCGMPCVNAPHAKNICSNSACVLTLCDQGFADCDAKPQNGCEVVIATDAMNCGKCGNVCPMGLVCQNQGCTCPQCNIPNAKSKCINNQCVLDSCLPGYADCNNDPKDGCEVNLAADKNNCNGCGKACPMAQTCVNAVCATCNNMILVLGDDQGAADMQLAADINNAGLTAMVVNNGGINYQGNPPADGFGAVVVLVGNNYGTDMPPAGQASIVNAVGKGTGVIFTEWAAFHVENARWGQLGTLELLKRSSGTTSTLTYVVEVNHPVLMGLPMSFTTVNMMGANVGNTLLNGGVRIAGCTECMGAGVVVKDNGGGRIVQMSHAGNYMGGGQMAWSNDKNIILLMQNAAKWAARCL